MIDIIKNTTQAAIIGDCVGAFNEFNFGTKGKKRLRNVDLELLKTKRDVFNNQYGNFTDDTTCALITMRNFKYGEFDVPAIKRDMKRWIERGAFSSTGECFDVGTGTAYAILKDQPVTDPSKGAGNGALMRMYPVAIATYGRSQEDIERIVKYMTEFTHPVPLCLHYSMLYVRIMHRIFDGVNKRTLSKEFGAYFDEDSCLTTGYVKDSLTIAWRVFLEFEHKEYGIFLIANMGLDSDTIASIYGSMIGAYTTVQNKSQEFTPWLVENIKRQDLVDSIVKEFTHRVVCTMIDHLPSYLHKS